MSVRWLLMFVQAGSKRADPEFSLLALHLLIGASFRLTPWDPSLHEQVRDRMMLLGGASGDKPPWDRSDKHGGHGHGGGLSWIDTDTMTYMTEPAKGVSD